MQHFRLFVFGMLCLCLFVSHGHAQLAFGFPDLTPPQQAIGTQATHNIERWDDFLDYANDPLYGTLGKSVGQLAIYYSGSPYPYVCTGTLISERYVITNYHCVYPSKEYEGRELPLANIRMYMNYHRPSTGRNAAEVKQFALFNRPVEYSADFDYAILEVAGTSPASEFGYVPVRFGDYRTSDSLFIVHHSAEPSFDASMSDHKRITFRDCQTLNFSDISNIPIVMPDGKGQRKAVEGRDVPHFCDTTGGSSGSLVFNANGQIVGLHFAGLRNGNIPERNRFNLFININAILSQSQKLREVAYADNPAPEPPTSLPTPPAPNPVPNPVPSPTPVPTPVPTPQQRGYISVDSNPRGITVALNGQRIGQTPLQNYATNQGIYQLSLSYNGTQLYSEAVRVVANQQLRRNVDLRAVIPSNPSSNPAPTPPQGNNALITTSEELIRRASRGGRLELAATTFILTQPLQLSGNVELIGQGNQRTRIISTAANYVMYYLGGGTFSARGVSFERVGGQGDVVYLAGGNLSVDSCSFSGGTKLYNDAADVTGAGIAIGGSAAGSIRNSHIDNNHHGIVLHDRRRLVVERNVIRNNTSILEFTIRRITTANHTYTNLTVQPRYYPTR